MEEEVKNTIADKIVWFIERITDDDPNKGWGFKWLENFCMLITMCVFCLWLLLKINFMIILAMFIMISFIGELPIVIITLGLYDFNVSSWLLKYTVEEKHLFDL